MIAEIEVQRKLFRSGEPHLMLHKIVFPANILVEIRARTSRRLHPRYLPPRYARVGIGSAVQFQGQLALRGVVSPGVNLAGRLQFEGLGQLLDFLEFGVLGFGLGGGIARGACEYCSRRVLAVAFLLYRLLNRLETRMLLRCHAIS